MRSLVHRVVVERAKPVEVQALNTFSQMIKDLCGATPVTIKESLDALPVERYRRQHERLGSRVDCAAGSSFRGPAHPQR